MCAAGNQGRKLLRRRRPGRSLAHGVGNVDDDLAGDAVLDFGSHRLERCVRHSQHDDVRHRHSLCNARGKRGAQSLRDHLGFGLVTGSE